MANPEEVKRGTLYERTVVQTFVERRYDSRALSRRKNHLFNDVPRGAYASAAVYSIVTTAKMNGLNPRLYLE